MSKAVLSFLRGLQRSDLAILLSRCEVSIVDIVYRDAWLGDRSGKEVVVVVRPNPEDHAEEGHDGPDVG